MITPVTEQSQVAEARRTASALVRELGFGEQEIGRAALVATELATNLVKHGGGGEMVIDRFEDSDGSGIELLALDKGNGIADLQRCLADGYSTAGSPGTGLGAVDRKSDRFAAFSRPGLGSAMMARLTLSRSRSGYDGIELGALTAPYPGETVSGDRWAFAEAAAGPTLMLADGTGHGFAAAAASDEAAKIFLRHAEEAPDRILERLHAALAPTRGAAVAIARFVRAERMVHFVGVGNIVAAVICGGEVKRMVSHNGTVGHVAPRIRIFQYPAPGEPMLLLHSDGLSSRWDLTGYPGLANAHPSLVAGILFRDHRRSRDDACVAALRVLR